METHNKNPVFLFLVSLIFLLFSSAQFSHAVSDTIRQGEMIRDGEKLISEKNVFELGFFSPAANSRLRYVGIWYTFDSKAVVWVANRDKPISDRNGVLRIESDGTLVVRNGNKSPVWSSKVPRSPNNTTATLRDNGNFVLSKDDSIGVAWQSFDEPTDTFFPGMRVPVSSKIGEYRPYRSWKSANDPSSGNYSMGVDPNGGPQIVIWHNNKRWWRSGHWNNQFFTGVPYMRNNGYFFHGFDISRPDVNGTMYITYYINPSTPDLFRFLITSEGREQQLRWNNGTKEWQLLQSQPDPSNKCDLYDFCGSYATCNTSDPRTCACLEGFTPKYQGGCERKTELHCSSTNGSAVGKGKPDGFKRTKCSKLPDLANLLSSAEDINACKSRCLENCSCVAYAFIPGIRCMIWTGDLVDMQHYDQAGSLEFFYRLHHSELGTVDMQHFDQAGSRKISSIVIVIISVVVACFLVPSAWLLWRYKKKLKVSSIPCCKDDDVSVFDLSKTKRTEISGPSAILIDGNQDDGPELPIYNFSYVAVATKNFCEENKLGQGGFGAVYKGELPGGKIIAVKRLSGQTGQGLEEFKTEIVLIAKLQHRNLVKLLGCSIQGEEKLLIYEYMHNKSLDYYLFDEAKKAKLDWRTRFSIIEGIARGLLYLHRDSRLLIIHRDLKASNILLDAEMNPKISDFGLARIFRGNQPEKNTVRVVGTYGYMSPEYAMGGLFSVKSDVYSFGVLLLEIISGQRNICFQAADHTSLISYAWHLWCEDKVMDLVDPCILESCSPNEVVKCIHIGMLCVQDSAARRPKMSAVVLLLESETATLPMPTKPTYTSLRTEIEEEYLLDGQEIVSANHLTVTMVVGR